MLSSFLDYPKTGLPLSEIQGMDLTPAPACIYLATLDGGIRSLRRVEPRAGRARIDGHLAESNRNSPNNSVNIAT